MTATKTKDGRASKRGGQNDSNSYSQSFVGQQSGGMGTSMSRLNSGKIR